MTSKNMKSGLIFRIWEMKYHKVWLFKFDDKLLQMPDFVVIINTDYHYDNEIVITAIEMNRKVGIY